MSECQGVGFQVRVYWVSVTCFMGVRYEVYGVWALGVWCMGFGFGGSGFVVCSRTPPGLIGVGEQAGGTGGRLATLSSSE